MSLQTLGQNYTSFQNIISYGIGVALILGGIYKLVSSGSTERLKLQGTIVEVEQCSGSRKGRKCPITISYSFNGKEYVFDTVAKKKFSVDKTLPIYIDRTKPEEAFLDNGKNLTTGFGIIALGIFSIITAYIRGRVVQESSTYATVQGASAIYTIFKYVLVIVVILIVYLLMRTRSEGYLANYRDYENCACGR
jgi:amino acid transporter